MKKVLIIIYVLLFTSCTDDEIKIPDIVSDRYNIETKSINTGIIPALYIKVNNAAEGVNISIPGEAEQKIFVKNENLQDLIESYMSSSNDMMVMIRKLNYIDFVSNGNLSISYKDDNNLEFIFPDMLLDDGSLKRTFKYRKNFDKLFPRITEPLARFFKIPLMGELAPSYALCHKIINNQYLIYVDFQAIKAYSAMLPMFGLEESTIKMVNDIINQYRFSGDTLEIGVYLKNVN